MLSFQARKKDQIFDLNDIGKLVTWRGNSALNCTWKQISHGSHESQIDPGTSSVVASSSRVVELLLAIFWAVFTGFSRFFVVASERGNNLFCSHWDMMLDELFKFVIRMPNIKESGLRLNSENLTSPGYHRYPYLSLFKAHRNCKRVVRRYVDVPSKSCRYLGKQNRRHKFLEHMDIWGVTTRRATCGGRKKDSNT